MKCAVIVFPGSNCDIDCHDWLVSCGFSVDMLWHNDTPDRNYDILVIPGGFSYGDYLRPGVIAAKSKIIDFVISSATKGSYVIGICNGFQILLEMGLLPGALTLNKSTRFICKSVDICAVGESVFTDSFDKDSCYSFPISHHSGCYYIDQDGLKEIQDNGMIAFCYKDNPNGSANSIAGITNKNKNILAIMPHPDRAYSKALGNTNGNLILDSFV